MTAIIHKTYPNVNANYLLITQKSNGL